MLNEMCGYFTKKKYELLIDNKSPCKDASYQVRLYEDGIYEVLYMHFDHPCDYWQFHTLNEAMICYEQNCSWK